MKTLLAWLLSTTGALDRGFSGAPSPFQDHERHPHHSMGSVESIMEVVASHRGEKSDAANDRARVVDRDQQSREAGAG